MQEFVTLNGTAQGQPTSTSIQEATGLGTNPLRGSPSSPGHTRDAGDSRHARSLHSEDLHEQQAVLNQLKEVPIKSMSASLLVAPLLDFGKAHFRAYAGACYACQKRCDPSMGDCICFKLLLGTKGSNHGLRLPSEKGGGAFPVSLQCYAIISMVLLH